MIEKISALKVYLGNGKWISHGVIEKENGRIERVYSLQECQSEPAHTTFYNGMITPGLQSINENEIRKYFLLKQQTGLSFYEIFDILLSEKHRNTETLLLWEDLDLILLKVTKNTLIRPI